MKGDEATGPFSGHCLIKMAGEAEILTGGSQMRLLSSIDRHECSVCEWLKVHHSRTPESDYRIHILVHDAMYDHIQLYHSEGEEV